MKNRERLVIDKLAKRMGKGTKNSIYGVDSFRHLELENGDIKVKSWYINGIKQDISVLTRIKNEER